MVQKTRTTDDAGSDAITARWKATPASKEVHFGTIALDEEFRLTFPMLDSPTDIPSGTTVLWGVTDKLRRCTVLTLPFGPIYGGTSNIVDSISIDRIFNASSAIRHLLIGKKYLDDPTTTFVSQIAFTPRPNKDLCKLPYSTRPEDLFKNLFELAIKSPALTVSASIAVQELCISLNFESPRSLDAALEEANMLCVFLSFTAHQYVYPTNFHVWAAGQDSAYEVHCRTFGPPPTRDNTWVGYTLTLPDEQPTYSHTLQRWYATNGNYLRGRFLYRYSLKEPNVFSPERFLSVFKALEGAVDKSGYHLLTADELNLAKATLRQCLSTSPRLEDFIGKLNNSESPAYILKRELPKILDSANLIPGFDVAEFIDRIYSRRNKASHGGRHLDSSFDSLLVPDTVLLTAIYLAAECCQLGLNATEALRKFRGAFSNMPLPLTLRVP